MKTVDKLGTFLKELPMEATSDDFTRLVMERVRLEAVKSQVAYAPLISSRLWWKILAGSLLFLLAAVLLHEYFPGKESTGVLLSLQSVDFSFVLKPFQSLTKMMNSLPFALISGVMAICVLLAVDQLHGHLAKY